jgi:hypothetical protein
MPRGLSGPPPLRERVRTLFSRESLPFVTMVGVTLAAGVTLVGSYIKNQAELDARSAAQTQAMAAQLWRENGYEVTGLKSYEVLRETRAVTHFVKKTGEAQTYRATALCREACSIRKIESY